MMNKKITDSSKMDATSNSLSDQNWRVWKNVGDMWRSQVHRFSDRVMAVAKVDGRWKDISWNEVDSKAKSIASGLLALNMAQGESIAIFSKTRIEWIYAAIGLIQAGGDWCAYTTPTVLLSVSTSLKIQIPPSVLWKSRSSLTRSLKFEATVRH